MTAKTPMASALKGICHTVMPCHTHFAYRFPRRAAVLLRGIYPYIFGYDGMTDALNPEAIGVFAVIPGHDSWV